MLKIFDINIKFYKKHFFWTNLKKTPNGYIGGVFMSKKKYKFYRNKKTRNHPSIEINSNNEVWENMEVTSSPTKKNRYIELKKNPNPKRNDKAYVRKYLRKDPIRTRGQLLVKFNLSEEDLKEIEEYILNNKNKKC